MINGFYSATQQGTELATPWFPVIPAFAGIQDNILINFLN
jgi:hypothetical protein